MQAENNVFMYIYTYVNTDTYMYVTKLMEEEVMNLKNKVGVHGMV